MSGDDTAGYLPVARFAALYSVSIRTVRLWIAEGKVEAVRSPGGLHWRVRLAPPAKNSGKTRQNAAEPT